MLQEKIMFFKRVNGKCQFICSSAFLYLSEQPVTTITKATIEINAIFFMFLFLSKEFTIKVFQEV